MDGISAYFQLTKKRPELFAVSGHIPLVLDENKMRTFSEKSGKAMGVVYDNSPFYIVLADLCSRKEELYSYARVIYCNPDSSGCIAVPRCGPNYGLLRIFRHTSRSWSLEFPRGFAEDPALTAEENIRKELSEELGISGEKCTLLFLGNVRTDSGLSNGTAQVFLTDIDESAHIVPADEEGIAGVLWISEMELKKMIRAGEITDSLTLAAYAKVLCFA